LLISGLGVKPIHSKDLEMVPYDILGSFILFCFIAYSHTLPWAASLFGVASAFEPLKGLTGLMRAGVYVSLGYMFLCIVAY